MNLNKIAASTQKAEWIALLAQADSGDAEAQYDVGMAYHDGFYNRTGIQVEQDFKKASEWFNRSLKGGKLEAMVVVADYLSEGLAGEKDLPLAIKLYQEAIVKGSGVAANNLGRVYRDEGDFEKAFSYYQLSEKLSGVSYSLPVGLCYYYGIGTEVDKARALEIFHAVSAGEESCSSGYEMDEANFMLGQMYLQGAGVERSVEKARHFLEKADEEGDHRSAQEILTVIGRSRETS